MRPPHEENQEPDASELETSDLYQRLQHDEKRFFPIWESITKATRRLSRPAPTFRWLGQIVSTIARRRREERLTVGVDIASFWEPLTGVGWYLYRLLESLAHRDDVRLRLYGPAIVESPDLPAPVVAVPSGPALERVSIQVPGNLIVPPGLVSRILRRIEPLLLTADRNDVFFAPNFFLPRRFNLVGGARVVTIHDLSLRQVPWTMRSETLRELSAKLEHACFEATRLITDSRAVRDELVAYGYARPARIRAVHLGPGHVLQEEDTPSPARVPSYFGLHVGTLEPRKNIVRLLDAWRLIRQQLAKPPALVLSGQFGWKSREIQREIRLAEREGWLQHLGYVTEGELANLYREAAVVVFPSLYEGFGLPAVEAMFADTPLVCSDIEVLREVAGEAALYAPADSPSQFAERVIELLTDPDLARSLVQKGGERRERFNWRRTAGQTLAVWAEAAGVGLARQPGDLLTQATPEGGRV